MTKCLNQQLRISYSLVSYFDTFLFVVAMNYTRLFTCTLILHLQLFTGSHHAHIFLHIKRENRITTKSECEDPL